MARTKEVEALRDASELIAGIADAVESGETDRLPASADLRSFADHCRLLADEADDKTLSSEMLDEGRG